MNETENAKQSEKPSAPVVSKWATISFWCALIGWGFYVIELVFPFVNKAWINLLGHFSCFGIMLNLIALVTGIIALIIIWLQKESRAGIKKASIGIILGVAMMTTLIPAFVRVNFIINRITCGMNMEGLSKALQVYSNDYHKYPSPDKWCDLLMEHEDCVERNFVCRGGGKGRCHYAINPNCEPNSPSDVVLLFETKGGWNQYGGQELLTFENHGGKYANIFFNDIHGEAIEPNQVGKLKWKAEDVNNIK